MVNIAMALLFAFAVAVQYNDPDPGRWVLVYGVGVVICAIAAARDDVPERPVIAYGVVTACAAVLQLRYGEGSPAEHVEVVREAAGLGLLAVWCFTVAIWTRYRRPVREGG